MTTVESLSWISHQFAIYFGIPLFVFGIIGNTLNIVMFLSKKIFSRSPCQLYLLTASISSLFAIIFPLLLRILVALQYDLAKTNIFFCKFRQYAGHVSLLIPLTCVALATIDRYLITCREVRFRQLSKISIARVLCVLTVVFWSLHGLPMVILNNLYVTTGNQTACINPSVIYGYYLNYVIVLIYVNLLPLSVFIIFGFLTWKNMRAIGQKRAVPQQQRLSVNKRQEQKLTRMLLLQIAVNSISIIPYAIFILYSTITSQMQKDALKSAKESLCSTITNLVFYLNFAASFYIYLSSSKSLKYKLLRKIFSPCGGCQTLAEGTSTVTPATATATTNKKTRL